jgi:DNA-binding GntR family transcriptional regulator
MDVKPIKPTGGQVVYEALRRAIMSLELAPGSSLEEGGICRQFRVSRTPVREALIRLASEGLADLQPNRGARVAALGFADVVDHYEAMDIFMPVACHFAAIRRTREQLANIRVQMAKFTEAVRRKDSDGIVLCNFELHSAIAAACHNRCVERGYRQMLTDKLRLAQHGLSGTAHDRGRALADRFRGTARLSAKLVSVIARGDGRSAERAARALNAFVRSQVIGILSASLAREIRISAPRPR